MFKWEKEFETGNAIVDEQHKTLFEIGERAFELLKNDLYTDKYDKIIDIIHELKDYTVFHFRAEEEYMLKVGYKGLFSHKMEHDGFIEKFNQIDYNRIDQGQNDYIYDLLNFIADWITEHILIKDRQHSRA